MKKIYLSLTCLLGVFNLYAQEVFFETDYQNLAENADTALLNVSISGTLADTATIELIVLNNVSTANATTDYNFTTQILSFAPNGSTTQSIPVTLIDNQIANPDKMLVFALQNPSNISLGANKTHVLYLFDNEKHIATPYNTLGINYATNFAIEGNNPGSEILTYSAATQRLFVMNSGNASVEILDFSNPLAISTINSIDLSAYGAGGTSVAHHNGYVAVSLAAANKTDNGKVVFLDTDGNIITNLEVGALPDMLCFTPDGNKLLVTNEGEPNADYSIDPEGSIAVIDLSNGIENLNQNHVSLLNFNSFDNQKAALQAAQVRIFGPNASVSQDLEPEYITVAANSQKAWVSLQENNAYATIDLNSMQITNILPLGLKDHSLPGNTLDTSNKADSIFMANWPIKGMYMPDAIDNYTLNGVTYLVTANEGDAREYDTFEEEVNLEDLNLDPSIFPNHELLAHNDNLGKIKITNQGGDLDNDGVYEEIHVFGGRSFSIYNAETGVQVYDSGDDFERIIEEDPTYKDIFNTTDDENKLKNRSDNKGPEPEAVLVKEIANEFYAFIALERVGGFMVYNISNPNNPVFEGYFNNRSTAPGENIVGDLAPESIIYIAPNENTLEKGLLVIANEVSATVSVYTLDNNSLSTKTPVAKSNFSIYPNPASTQVYFNKPTNYRLYNMQGKLIKQANNAFYLNIEDVNSGIYIIKNTEGTAQKLIVK